MRIGGTDARFTGLHVKNGENSGLRGIANKPVRDPGKEEEFDIHDMGNLSKFERNELPISDSVVLQAIEKANDAISVANRRFEYSIHEKTKEIMVKVIDSNTDEVIREIPPEKILDMVAKMWEMAGLLVDERR